LIASVVHKVMVYKQWEKVRIISRIKRQNNRFWYFWYAAVSYNTCVWMFRLPLNKTGLEFSQNVDVCVTNYQPRTKTNPNPVITRNSEHSTK